MRRDETIDMAEIDPGHLYDALAADGWTATYIGTIFTEIEKLKKKERDKYTPWLAVINLYNYKDSYRGQRIISGDFQGIYTDISPNYRNGVIHDYTVVIDGRLITFSTGATVQIRKDEPDGTEDAELTTTIKPPTEPGFYKYSGGNQNMIFLLEPRQKYQTHGQWTVFFSNGQHEMCEWGYIEQALSVYKLVRI